MCVLVGYGADAICPYMVFEIAQMLREENVIEVDDDTAYENYAAAVDRGISKVLTRGKSLLESWGTTFLPNWQQPLIYVWITSKSHEH